MRPVIYVAVNKALNMSPGKIAAQVGHAVAGLIADTTHGEWLDSPHRWMIVLAAEDETHLQNLERYLNERKVKNYLVLDEGVNEIRPFSITALGVGILDKDSSEAFLLNGLKKYTEHGYHVHAVPDIDLSDALHRVLRHYLNRRGRRKIDSSI